MGSQLESSQLISAEGGYHSKPWGNLGKIDFVSEFSELQQC